MSTSAGGLNRGDGYLHSTRGITLTRGSVRSYPIQVVRVAKSAGRITETAIDLTGATIELTVVDPDGAAALSLSSDVSGEIDIRAQVAPDIGRADIHFVAANTEDLNPALAYRYEIWVTLASGEKDTVIDASPFVVVQRLTASP